MNTHIEEATSIGTDSDSGLHASWLHPRQYTLGDTFTFAVRYHHEPSHLRASRARQGQLISFGQKVGENRREFAMARERVTFGQVSLVEDAGNVTGTIK